MPAPDDLAWILNELGDGGTTAIAQRVAQLIEDARAQATAAAVHPDTAALQQQLDTATGQIADLGTVLLGLASFHDSGPVAFPGLEEVGPCGVAERLLARIHEGADSTPVPDDSWPTVGQLWHRLLTADLADREGILTRHMQLAEQAVTMPQVTSAALVNPVIAHADAATVARTSELSTVGPCGDAAPLATDTATPAYCTLAAGHTGIHTDGSATWSWGALEGLTPEERALAFPDAAGPSPDDIQWDDDPEQPAAPAAGPTNAQVRDWCIANRVPVSARGRISTEARAAYDAAHPKG